MGDNFERSIGGMNSSEFRLYESNKGDSIFASQDKDVSIFAVNKGAYDDTLSVISNFLRADPTLGNVASERDRLIKELYGSIENYLEEENIFMSSDGF